MLQKVLWIEIGIVAGYNLFAYTVLIPFNPAALIGSTIAYMAMVCLPTLGIGKLVIRAKRKKIPPI